MAFAEFTCSETAVRKSERTIAEGLTRELGMCELLLTEDVTLGLRSDGLFCFVFDLRLEGEA
jgi:hypothetical protein